MYDVKNRPWDLLNHLHIVRRNIACFCKAVQVTRHNLFHQLNHNKVLNKNIIYFFLKTNTTVLFGNFLSVSERDFHKVAPQTSPYDRDFLESNFYMLNFFFFLLLWICIFLNIKMYYRYIFFLLKVRDFFQLWCNENSLEFLLKVDDISSLMNIK